MAVILDVEQPEDFLADMRKKIENGQINNWLCDGDGDFTTLSCKMENRAWFHPYIVSDNKLVFGILGRKNVLMTMDEYAIFHSSMVNTILNFYSKRIRSIRVTVPFDNEYDTRRIEY